MRLPDRFRSFCPACSAPQPLGATCAACSAGPPDSEAGRRLQLHLGRVRRATAATRTVLACHMGIGASTRYGPLIVVGFLGLLIVPPLAAVASFVLILLSGHEWWAVAAALSAIVLQGLAFVAALALTYLLATKLQARARTRARVCSLDLMATRPQRCEACGAYATALARGAASPLACPWCDAALQPGSPEIAEQAAADAILAQRSEIGEWTYQRTLRRARRASEPVAVPLEGFEMRAGLIHGEIDGVRIWSGHDVGPDGTYVRIEVPLDTPVTATWWFVRRAGERRLRSAAEEWGFALPSTPRDSPHPGILAYAEAGSPALELEALGSAVARLDPNECLLLEPAGVAVWRHLPSLLMRAWAPLLRHHDTLGALAGELRAARQRR